MSTKKNRQPKLKLVISRSIRDGHGSPPDVKLGVDLQETPCDALDFLRAEFRNYRSPLPDGDVTDVQRLCYGGSGLEVGDNVGFEHRPTLTLVDGGLQPEFKPNHLTLVDMTLADRLKSAMDEEKTSNADLAKACHVSVQAVFKWLGGGNMKADSLALAAKRLKVRQEWLRSGKGPRKATDAESIDADTQRVLDLLVGLQAPLAQLSDAISEIGRLQSHGRKATEQ